VMPRKADVQREELPGAEPTVGELAPRPVSGQTAPSPCPSVSEPANGDGLSKAGGLAYQTLLRRVPSQQRGRDKVARILDAAEELLVEQGYEKAVSTPALLIERARVSGGSFYTYFSSPESVMEALALRFMESDRATGDKLAREVYPNWEEAANRFFDAFVGFYRPLAVRELWLKGHLSRRARQADDDSNAYLAQLLVEMVSRATIPGPHLRPICYRVAIEIYDAVMRLAYRADRQERRDLFREAKQAAISYLVAAARGEDGQAGTYR
jgi:AcrR family transcriptional regulator